MSKVLIINKLVQLHVCICPACKSIFDPCNLVHAVGYGQKYTDLVLGKYTTVTSQVTQFKVEHLSQKRHAEALPFRAANCQCRLMSCNITS